MDLEIRRRESTGSGANTHVETETLAKFELMDGAPVRGILLTTMLICTINKRFCIMAKIKYDPINLLYWDHQVRQLIYWFLILHVAVISIYLIANHCNGLQSCA